MALSVFNKPNINVAIKAPFLLYSQSLRSFFKKILKIFKFLLIVFETNLERIFNIS